MTQSPWLSIVLLGVAITGYAWMMPKQASKDKGSEFQSEAAYEQLLEDLEAENRELVDAVAKFKREQDDTVDRLSRRIVDMEHQMKLWSLQAQAATVQAAATMLVQPSVAAPSSDSEKSAIVDSDIVQAPIVQTPFIEPEADPIVIPPSSIRGRYPELLELHDRGRSVEQIAKAMNMNKGEVQLILQLVRREEEQHA
ncbi:hypothetical protein [Cohnella yongneupensis]|uniref:DUF2802 domain-containing protein n=1 Tax=Cohnella yongneupensis TaxID=425006 RepID=A0ABW0R5H2_9BACL